jgi:hypothetical protein
MYNEFFYVKKYKPQILKMFLGEVCSQISLRTPVLNFLHSAKKFSSGHITLPKFHSDSLCVLPFENTALTWVSHINIKLHSLN